MWWYTGAFVATKSNKIKVTYNWQAISSVLTWTGGWIVYWSWTIAWTINSQIWAKWTIWKEQLWSYLSKDLYDPEVWDVKVWTSWAKMIDKWIGKYVYAIYKKSYAWPSNQWWVSYNIAFTVKKDWNEEWYLTKIVWDYDKLNYGD